MGMHYKHLRLIVFLDLKGKRCGQKLLYADIYPGAVFYIYIII